MSDSGLGESIGSEETYFALTVESFESFYLRQYQSVLGLAYVLTGDAGAAEDLTQEAFLAAFRSWKEVMDPERWIRRAVSNQAMSWWRRSYAARRALSRLTQFPAAAAEIPEDTESFWREVRRLPRRQAQAIALYYLEDHSTDEIAALLGCKVSTVRIHLSRGRRTLASRLGVEG
jgi:RNA polymerase sigma-70 factor, ECF subfamily